MGGGRLVRHIVSTHVHQQVLLVGRVEVAHNAGELFLLRWHDVSVLPEKTATLTFLMSLQKQLEYNKGLFMYRVLSNEAPEYISNLYTHTPSRYSNSRNYHLSLPRPRIDIFKTSISFSGLSMEQPTSGSQILSATQFFQA